MPIVNRLVVSVAVLRLAGYACDVPDTPTAVHIAPASTTVASIQVLATLPPFLQTPDAPLPSVVTATPTPTPTLTLPPVPGPAPFAIEYRITGTATHCSATYENDKGGTSQSGVNVPFTYSWNGAKSGDFLYVSCQIDTAADHGDLAVAIYRNGVLYKSATATAFPSSATTSGSY